MKKLTNLINIIKVEKNLGNDKQYIYTFHYSNQYTLLLKILIRIRKFISYKGIIKAINRSFISQINLFCNFFRYFDFSINKYVQYPIIAKIDRSKYL